MTADPGAARRRTAILALGLGTAVFLYGLHRGQPLLQAARQASAQAEQLEAQRLTLAGAPAELARLRSGLERLTAQVARVESETLARGRFASPAQAAELTLQVSQLAARSGLRIDVQEPLDAAQAARRGGAATSRLAATLSATPLGRPLHAWTLQGSFPALYAFLTRLDTLPWRVVVLRLDVERPQGAAEGDDPPLELRMTVAL